MADPVRAVSRPEIESRGLLPPHTIRIPAGRGIDPFDLGRTPVTNREYAPFVDAGRAAAPPWWTHRDFCGAAQPVVGVTWHEAMEYGAWLSESFGGRWRLPTEAEWEHAACGGLAAPRTAWGESVPPGEIPEGPIAGPWEAGRGTPNGYGLLDMGTIVHEWCLEWADGRPGPRRRASRGGSWRHDIRWSSPAARSSLPPEYRYSDYGFRLLREVGPAARGDGA